MKPRGFIVVLAEQSTTDHEDPAVVCPMKIAVDYPTMPRAGEDDRREIDDEVYAYHREKCGQVGARGLALVARPVRPKEVKTNPAAQASPDKGYNALCHELKAWDMNGVREWTAVQDEARKANKRVHVGMIFGICVEKNAELPAGNPNRKYKGRFVFQGNHVRDEENVMALFQDLGSAPASMAPAKMLDLVASLPGCRGGQTDAVRAYTQALLKGTETWIRIPRDRLAQGVGDDAGPGCPIAFGLVWPPRFRHMLGEALRRAVAQERFCASSELAGCVYA